MWLTTTATLDELACLTDYLTGMLAFLDKVVRECYGEGWLATCCATNGDKQTLWELGTELEGDVLGILWVDRQDA